MKLFKWKKRDGQETVTTARATDAVDADVTPSDSQSTRAGRSSVFVSKRVRVLGGIVVLIVVGAVSYIVWQQKTTHNSSAKENPPYVVSDEAFAEVRVSSLKKSPPAESASMADKVNYYDELMTNELTAGDSAAAIKTFETASAKFGETNLTFNMYVAAAQSYAKAGDKAKAQAALNTAEQFVNKTVSNQTDADDFRRTLTYFRTEISR